MPTQHDENQTHRPRTEPDASAGWKEEYATQGVDARLCTDGGRAVPSAGDRVRDRDSDDELVVVEVLDDRADTHEIDAVGATVAELNLEYDAEAPVVEAVYADDVDGARSVEDLREAIAFDVLRSYSFPADRLAPVAGGDGL